MVRKGSKIIILPIASMRKKDNSILHAITVYRMDSVNSGLSRIRKNRIRARQLHEIMALIQIRIRFF